MTNRFLISVAAAALIAGTGFANAQGMNREGGAAAQQSAPSSERAAPSGTINHDAGGMKGAESSGTKGSEKSGMKAESNENMPAAKSAQDTRPDAKGEKSKSMSSENDSAKGGMKAEGTKTTEGTKATEGTKTNGSMNAEGSKANGSTTAQTKSEMDSKTTTGNAATSATAAPPAEKRTQIVSAIKSEKIEETTNVNFNISVGATIPGTVRFHPLPARIVEIYPEWRGYDVIFVHGRYIIVRPQTHEIVYIIEG
jgi:hypothetical protein